MAGLKLTTPSRRATLLGAVAIASATIAVSGSAKASQISPALQKAFDEWQALASIEKILGAESTATLDRYNAIKPEIPAELLNGPAAHYCDAFGHVRIHNIRSKAALHVGSAKWVRALELAEQFCAACDAAMELSGHVPASEAWEKAFDDSHAGFVRFIRIRPKTMAEVQLQAVHLVEWSEEDSNLEEFVLDWMKSLAQLVS